MNLPLDKILPAKVKETGAQCVYVGLTMVATDVSADLGTEVVLGLEPHGFIGLVLVGAGLVYRLAAKAINRTGPAYEDSYDDGYGGER